MSRDERDRLRDVKEAILAIRAHFHRVGDEASVEHAALVHDALLFQFVILGEAVKNLAPETRRAEPEIPWSDVAGLRDLIAHEYFRIEIDRVLDVVRRDLDALERAVDRLLGE